MAKCEQGYLCDVCGAEVEEIVDSDLYLRYVCGQIRPDQLHRSPERHIRCNPNVAQFIVDANFDPIQVDGPFGKNELDAAYVAAQEELITRGWRRLQELPSLAIHIIDYPLPEVSERWRREAEATAARRRATPSTRDDQATPPDADQ